MASKSKQFHLLLPGLHLVRFQTTVWMHTVLLSLPSHVCKFDSLLCFKAIPGIRQLTSGRLGQQMKTTNLDPHRKMCQECARTYLTHRLYSRIGHAIRRLIAIFLLPEACSYNTERNMALHILCVIPILCLNLLKIPWRITANVTQLNAFYVVRLVAVMRNSKVKSFIKVHNTVKRSFQLSLKMFWNCQ